MALLLTAAGFQLEDLVKFVGDASAKDRLFRLAVNVCRLGAWACQKGRSTQAAAQTEALKQWLVLLPQRLKKLEDSLNNTRRLLRLGKISTMYWTLRYVLPKKYPEITLLALVEALKTLCLTSYFYHDHLKWASSSGVILFDGNKHGYRATCSWAFSLLCSLVMNLLNYMVSLERERQLRTTLQAYLLQEEKAEKQIQQQEKEEGERSSVGDEAESAAGLSKQKGKERQTNTTTLLASTAGAKLDTEKALQKLMEARRLIVLDFIKNVADLPSGVVGVMQWKDVVSPAILAIGGIISSCIAVYTTWLQKIRR